MESRMVVTRSWGLVEKGRYKKKKSRIVVAGDQGEKVIKSYCFRKVQRFGFAK